MYYSQDNIADSLLKLKKKHLLERQRQETEQQERMKGQNGGKESVLSTAIPLIISLVIYSASPFLELQGL